MITASDFRAVAKNTLRGFVTLALAPSGLVLRECSIHGKEGKRWVGMPSRPQLDPEGRHRVDSAGKRMYTPIVEIVGKAERERFQSAALAAVDRLLGRGAAP